MILISVDTLRQDALGCYGNADVRTPHIDALARDGVRFDEAFAHASSTLPSHASILFSDVPWALGILRNGDTLPPRDGSLAAVLRASGRQTAAFTSLAVLDSSFGLDQGFDHYADDVAGDPDRPYLFADEVNARVLPWLDAHEAQPFFLFVHYSDPHEPYAHRNAPADVEVVLNERTIGSASFLLRQRRRLGVALRPGRNELGFRALGSARGPRAPRYRVEDLALAHPDVRLRPASASRAADADTGFVDSLELLVDNPTGRLVETQLAFRGRAELARIEMKREYLREVEWVDAAVGELVAWLRSHDRYDDSLVMLVADHGEGLGDHGTMGHETQVYLSQLRVPMILVDHVHRGEEGQTATLSDVGPTLLGRLGLRAPASWRGLDLVPGLGKPQPLRDVRSATFFGTDPRAATHRRFSLLRAPHHAIRSLPSERTELFDLRADPGERRDLLDRPEPPGAFAALQPVLAEFEREAEARLRERAAPNLTPEQIERLKALGYLGGDEEP